MLKIEILVILISFCCKKSGRMMEKRKYGGQKKKKINNENPGWSLTWTGCQTLGGLDGMVGIN